MASATRLSTGGFLLSLFEHPGVFAAAALRRVDDERAALQRDAREPAGLHVNFLAVERERPQVDVPRLEAILDDGRDPRQRERGLCDVTARVSVDAPRELLAFLRRGMWPDQHAITARAVGGLDHQLVEVLE